MRDFWRDQLSAPRWAGARLAGSPDMYAAPAPRFSLRRQPTATVNFITCHDGFTLHDLVAYDVKHNQADTGDTDSGTDDNRSWNCGSGPADDGPVSDPAILALRRRQQRNFLATLLVSRGVPMLMAGDERDRTQSGNNNAYCLDTPLSWVDWTPGPDADNLTTVTRALLALRREAAGLRTARFPDPGPATPDEPVPGTGLAWYDPDGAPVDGADWDNAEGHSFAVVFPGQPAGPAVLVLVNAYWESLPFRVPAPPPRTGTSSSLPSPGAGWTLRLDTTAEDGTPASPAALAAGASVTVGPRAVVIAVG
jgi:isoamylase